jgi:hypothetical protein
MKFTQHIAPEAYKKLPKCLQFINHIPDQPERDVALLSAIAGVSACLPNYQFKLRGEFYYPAHYIYVVGPPQSGKGMVHVARKVAEATHNAIYSDFLQKKKEYESLLPDERRVAGKPPLRSLSLSADTTSAGFFRAIQHQDQAGCLMVASEAASLVASLGGEHGGFMGQLCELWDQSHLSKRLASDDELCEKTAPKLAMVLASTPDVFVDFLLKANNSGLLSRLATYIIDSSASQDKGWSMYCNNGLSADARKCGELVHQIYNYLLHGSLKTFHLSALSDEFNKFIYDMDQNVRRDNPSAVSASIRLGATSLRQLATLTAIRHKETEQLSSDVYMPHEDDVAVVEAITRCHAYHLLASHAKLPSAHVQIINPDELLKKMPLKFKAGEFFNAASAALITRRTAKRKLSNLVKSGTISPTGIRGWYVKKLTPSC